MLVSHSKLSTWRRCKRKFWFSYGLNYSEPSSVGRQVGTIGHKCLGMWYKSDMTPGVQNFIKQFAVDQGKTDEVPDKDILRLTNALDRYFPFSLEHDTEWEILAVEHHFMYRFGNDYLHGYIDLVVKTPEGEILAVENKFNQMVSTSHLALDPQSSLYIIGGESFGVQGVLYNIVRVKDGPTARENPVVREIVRRSPEFQDMLIMDTEIQMAEIERWEASPIKGRISYPNPTHTCSWDCSFHDACIRYSEGGDISELIKLPQKERLETKQPVIEITNE